ncbi:putative bifunctional diguanylate cyclase/phosphodiesterase [Oceanisphaera pacifica]|uniref:EAL domain-containing protein n=1 Tax=Oceanisphaera pacifica TaxID=2818389 RepID=A0ABS3ND39_9GAMM|nr:EAL domain-containing protein [Oceanisphaera pacifica]MBO1518519.1 EAL domain-containing protein [Oceanisphaera pacifica]
MDNSKVLWAAPTALCQNKSDRLKSLAANPFNLTRQIMNHIQEGVVVMDARGRVLEVNPAFCTLSELDNAQLCGVHITNISGSLHRRRYYREIWQQLQQHEHWQGEVEHYNRQGVRVTHQLMLHLVKDSQGQVEHILGIIDDVSQLKASEKQLSFLAHHDALTGAANRTFLLSWFSQLTSKLTEHESLALLFIDLDRFKPVNDNFGHGVGDQVLKELARRLQTQIDETGLLARIGGDEFVVVLPDTHTIAQLQHKAEQLLTQLKIPVKVGDYELSVGASMGVSFYPEQGKDIESLLRYADIAMYQAKRYSSNKICFFGHSQYAQLQDQQRLSADFHQAITDSQFFLQYQPVLATKNKQLLSLEVLLRWQHPQLGVLYPRQFLSAAAAAGSLYRLAEWVFIEAAQQLRYWRQHLHWQGGISVNLSGLELEQLRVAPLVALLQQQDVNPADFTLELGSDYLMRRSEPLSDTLAQLRAAGMSIYLNKVGEGRFNFETLNQLPIDGIKLDRCLFSEFERPFSQSVIRSLLLLSEALGIKVVACGVETPAQWQFLHEHGCHGVQGRLLAPPMHAHELVSYLNK